MKKILFFASALAGLLLAGSCQQENLEPVAQGNTVTYTVEIPEVTTKGAAVGNEASMINDLVYAVYKTSSGSVADALKNWNENTTFLYAMNYTTNPFENGPATISLELLNDQNHIVLLWAQHDNTWVTGADATALTNISYPADLQVKNTDDPDKYAAFSTVKFISANDKANTNPIVLTRPFAQINIATLDPTNYHVTIDNTVIKINGAGSAFNVASQLPEDDANVTYTWKRKVSADPLNVNSQDYDHYLAMGYVFANDAVSVDYTITTSNHGVIENNIPNVPVAKNYRTNIIGNLLTSDVKYNVTLDKNWGDEGKNMEVITEGLVKNINDDYEISNENGLAHAINNLMKDGGNYYLTAAEYDMTGINVNPLTFEADEPLNIYGETPVVTRSTTPSFAGITIKGLDSIIETISADANVSISGVELVDEGSVLVETNNGTLVVSESKGEEKVVGNGNDPVKADDVKDVATLNAALASAVKTINITESFAAGDVVLVGRSVVINGNDKTFTTSASRAFRLTTSDIEVTFNNLDIVSDAVRVGTNDVRGVSVDIVENITLTLNDCSHDFNDPSANDWAYAVNVTGGKNHTVTINGGVYEGANVINVRGTAQIVTVKNATLNSTYPNNDLYYGSCIWVEQKQGSSVYAEGNTFNGNNAIAFNLGTGTALEEKDNVDNTKKVVAKVGEAYYTSLAEAFAAAESGATVKVLQNTNLTSSVTNGKSLVLDLNGKKIAGVEGETGSFGLINVSVGTELTINGPGTITLKSENNRGWNAYSSVVSNQRGTLTVNEGVVIEHLGGTDMAYGIDNLTNGKETKATTTVNGATIISPYTAIRQFLNGTEADNALTVNAGSVIEGGSRGVWMQGPSVNTNSGSLSIKEGAEVSNLHISLTEGTTTVDIELSAAASAIGEGGVTYKNVPAGYSVENVGGVWKVIAWTSVSTADELVAALEANQSVVFANDIKIEPASMSNAYGTTGINVKNGQTIDGGGYTLNIQGAGGTWDSGINTTGGLIKNLTVTGSFRGIFINHTSTYSEKVVLENVTIGGNGTVYTISCDQGLYQGIEATNCTFNGWTSFAKTAGEAKFVNCSFGEGSGYKYCRPYSNTEFVNCTFCPGYAVDKTQATVTFTDCIAKVASADDLVAALEAGFDVLFLNDIKIDPASMSNAYGTTGINVKNGQTIDGGGYTLNIQGAGGTWDSGINTTGGLIKNLTVTGSFRGIFINHTSTYSEKVVLENVTIGGNGTVYTISCDQGLYQGIEATNCTFNGWTSFAKTAGEAKFVNCTFGEGSGYKYCRPYSNTEFVNCTFCPGYAVDETQATVTFTNCTWE